MKPQVLDRGSLKNLPVGQIVMGTAQLWYVLLIHGMKYEKTTLKYTTKRSVSPQFYLFICHKVFLKMI